MVNKRGVPFGPTWLTRTLGVRLGLLTKYLIGYVTDFKMSLPNQIQTFAGKKILKFRGLIAFCFRF